VKEVVGTTGKVLEIDLSHSAIREFLITPQERQQYIGGKGLGLYYLSQRLSPGIDPVSPENPLILMMGPLLGTNAPCSGRFDAVTKSPLTGIVVSSSCGGPFGMALKTAGYEGLILTGQAAAPTTLLITPEGVSLQDAAALWGQPSRAAQASLQLGKQDGALVIGPAGENLVRYANIISGERFLGRGGLGAVMGSKNVKAIVARGGAYKIGTADPQQFAKIHKLAVRQINANKFTGTMYRNYGTASNVNLCNEGMILPVNNFTAGQDNRAGAIAGETTREAFGYKPSTCRPCSILCGHKGVYEGETRQAPEYETIGLLGSNLGIFDPLKISEWNEICADMGMDTITAGGTLAYVMEAAQKGLLPSGLRFGEPEGISETLQDIAYRRGIGDELANGSRWLAEKYGGMEFASQVKGLEMAGYDPRGSWGQGLAYAVANRGACHLSATLFPLEVFFKYIDPFTTLAKARFVQFLENLYSAVNSMQTCLFTGFAYIFEAPLVKYTPKFILGFAMQYLPAVAIKLIDISMFSKLLSLAAGMKFSPAQFLAAGERIHLLERYLNVREGISRKDDQLPKRFLTESRKADALGQVVPLDQMLDQYYTLRGYNPAGLPKLSTLRKAGITPAEDYQQLLDSHSYRTLKPRKGWIKSLVVSTVFFVLGRALQSLSRRDETIRSEAASWPEGTTVLFRVLPKGPRMAFTSKADGTIKYLGSKVGEQDATLVINFKNLEAAFLMMTAQLGTAKAYAGHRMSVRGDLTIALSNIRCLNVAERYLFPTIIAKNVVKRLPDIPVGKRYTRRLWVYTMGVLFGK